LKLQRIVLDNFRNHSSTLINCSPGINIFFGNNGEGKTNILEGISYFCLARSFYAANDSIVMKIGAPGFTATGKILSDSGVKYEIQIEYDRELNQKTVTVNKARVEKASSLIGWFPVVILSPEQSTITFGSPADRRRFIDFVVSQSSRTYLGSLIDYRRILKQRNKILSEMQATRSENREAIEPWNDCLIRVGSSIIKKRIEFIRDFYGIMVDAYAQLSGMSERPGITYSPSFEYPENNEDGVETLFKNALQNQFSDEQRVGYTLVGPHRDEFVFQINGLHAKNFASQGQHKTFLVALKLAEFIYLKNRCNETPILLLDDVLSELDEYRSRRLLEAVANTGQVFITSTDEHALEGLSVASANPRKFFVRQGRVERVENAAQIN
jgi:DNA replication and repair protein RecF